MSTNPTPATAQELVDTIKSRTTSEPRPKPFPRRIMHYVRRGHLFFGLFMVPWVLLYGITGFLFNHPEVFPDKKIVSFGSREIRGTPLEGVPSPEKQAQEVVDALNKELKPEKPFRLGTGKVRYGEGMLALQIKADDQTLQLQYDPNHNVGTLRTEKNPPPPEKSPFDLGQAGVTDRREMVMAMLSTISNPDPDGKKLSVTDPLHERVKAAAPLLCEKLGFPTGKIRIILVPDLVFPVDVDGSVWTAKFNARSGSVTGTPGAGSGRHPPGTSADGQMSFRRFLIGLHLSHRYPYERNIKWFWAMMVDVLAFVMCFWSMSGVFMWWQIKATRKAGAVVMVVSTVLATATGYAMHGFLTM
jgi:hypothetical protein